jgi:hypothetical protein
MISTNVQVNLGFIYLLMIRTSSTQIETLIKALESVVNTELQKLYDWLTASKLTLNIKKSNFVIFHSYKKRLDYQPKICVFDSEQNKYVNLEYKTNIKYLGLV